MPAGRPPICAHPAKPFRTLRDAARHNQLVLLRCNLCKRGSTFLATDLVKVVDTNHPIHIPPLACSQCGQVEFVAIRIENISYKDRGRLVIRKLVGSKQVWLWQNKVLEEK